MGAAYRSGKAIHCVRLAASESETPKGFLCQRLLIHS